ncbi:hypothetical protein LOTGIDRAFT_157221 [Lottia gigantea]|uniref:Uncharacterized protein n=1 Tax=Lottia gigantea TaxID=225164 RepID=V4CIR4_LOTGI|nr:hypothetical protein LOTGIDRAFT_157221 [Lottia gigantea]ESP02075.1 hypothetical protein LOTGIDRAFT_157221 [Lottia gigantea]
MANKFGLGSLALETKKPNTTAWINKVKWIKSETLFKVKVESIFFRQDATLINQLFNARKVLQFIIGTENVETKEFEINDENSKDKHLYEIKTSGKYIDRLGSFNMILETESPPSTSIIRNAEPQKEVNMSYELLRTTDFEYVKLYFVNNSYSFEYTSSTDLFTSIDIHKSQQNKEFIIFSSIMERNGRLEVGGFTSKQKSHYKKKTEILNIYLNKLFIFFERSREDKNISIEELEEFNEIFYKFDVEISSIKVKNS